MKKSKVLIPSMVLMCSLLTLCGCNQNNNENSSSNSVGNTSESVSENTSESNRNPYQAAWQIPEQGFDTNANVEIEFQTTMGDSLQSILAEEIETFKELYPNITVNHNVLAGSYNDLLNNITTELSVGRGPDLAYCYSDHVALYNKTKNVVTLDNLLEDDDYGITIDEYNNFIRGYYDEGKSFGDGLMYTLPFSKSTEILYYNKTVFAELQLTAPTHWFSNGSNDKTSLEYVCKTLKEKYPNSKPLGYDSSDNLFITLCEQYGSPYTSSTGNHFVFNNDTNKQFMKDIKEKFYDLGYLTTQSINGGYTSSLFNAYTSANTTGKDVSFMSIGSSAGASHQVPSKSATDGTYPFDVGVAQIPQVSQNNKKVISQGPSVCLFNHNDSQKIIASWLFLKHLTTSVNFQAEFSMASGYVPVIKNVSDNETYATFLASADDATADLKDRTVAAAAKLCVDQVDSYFTSPAFVGSSTARSQVGNLVTQYLTGQVELNKAFEDAITACEASI